MTSPGVWLGIDPGRARIGVAASDVEGILAVPVETVVSNAGAAPHIAGIAAERGAVAIIVGLPRSLSGEEGAAAVHARGFARRLAQQTSVPVRLYDERLTTVTATQGLQAAGRSARDSRAVIDQAAAVQLLQGALGATQARGEIVGELVAAVAEELDDSHG